MTYQEHCNSAHTRCAHVTIDHGRAVHWGAMPESTAGLLNAWREAERVLAAAVPGTSAYEAASQQVDACRDAYHARLAELADEEAGGGVRSD